MVSQLRLDDHESHSLLATWHNPNAHSHSVWNKMLHTNPRNIRGGLNLGRESVLRFPVAGDHQGSSRLCGWGATEWPKALHVPGTLLGASPLLPVVLQLLSQVWLFAIPWTAAHQAPLSFTISWSLLKLMSIESLMPSNHLILCQPLLLLSSIFPSIRVFSSESGFPTRGPKYWHFSISTSNEYARVISLGLTGLISLLSQGLSRIFSSSTVQ